MIEEIKINGIVYKLINNPTNNLACTMCDLINFCQKEERFIDLCENINNDGYYKKQ